MAEVKCPTCSKAFDNENSMKQHMQAHYRAKKRGDDRSVVEAAAS